MPKAFKNSTYNNIRFVLMDIEGTTSDINFVRNVLFPYSAKELRNFISTHSTNPLVQDCIQKTLADTTAGGANQDVETAITQLLNWIAADVKHPALKTLQGLIWKKGFENKDFKSHLYPDVVPNWRKWQNAGMKLGIYSSGSTEAQKLFFRYTTENDVLRFLVAHFDLEIGGKKEVGSYKKISGKVGFPPAQILFLSDIPEELQAAKAAGFQVAHIVRPGTNSHKSFKSVKSFDEL